MTKRSKVEGVYQRPESRYWWIAYTDPRDGTRKRVSSKTTIKEKAQREYHRLCNDLYDRIHFNAPVSITVKELIAWYRKSFVANKGTSADHVRFDSMVKRPLESFGDVVASKMKSQKILDYISDRFKEGVIKSTINRELVPFKAAYNAAMKTDEMLEKNPFATVKPFDVEDLRRDRALSADEQALLLTHSRGALHDLIYFGLMSGLRVGNILALKWSEVNLKTGQFPFLVRKGNKIKTYHHTMHPEVKQWLSARPSVGTHVFTNPNGQAYVPPGPTHSPFVRLVERLGKLYKMPHCTFHDLRHTHITDYLNGGGDIHLCSLNVGHSTVTMTARYGHLCVSRRVEDMSKIPGRLQLSKAAVSNQICHSDEKQISDFTETSSL